MKVSTIRRNSNVVSGSYSQMKCTGQIIFDPKNPPFKQDYDFNFWGDKNFDIKHNISPSIIIDDPLIEESVILASNIAVRTARENKEGKDFFRELGFDI